MREFAQKAGYRTSLGVPLLREGKAIGVIVLARSKVLPFTDKQIDLVTTFADQAVIAIENVRLFEAEQQRTRELTESLEQQTATSEVLRVISSSPGELEPVFQAMLENAVRICEAKFGILFRVEGENFHPVAHFNTPTALLKAQTERGPFKPAPGSPFDHLMQTKQVVHSADITKQVVHRADSTAEAVPGMAARLGFARSIVAVPMVKDDALIGAILIYREEVRPFSDKQINLVRNFAAQAVIAIENTRLLNELRQRTEDLAESLEQQTGTSEVLKVVSSSQGDLAPVFQAMLSNAVRICSARFGNLFLFDGCEARIAAMHNAPRAYEEQRRDNPVIPLDGTIVGPAVRTKRAKHVHDLATDKNYARSALARLAGARSGLAVPMLRDDAVIGGITIYRDVVQPFTDKQIALLQNFAAQAVIAIENARLLNELRQRTLDLSESLEQQTATAEVLRVISSSPGDLTPVFNTMLENATKLCGAEFGVLYLDVGDLTRIAAAHNVPPALAATQNVPLRVHSKSGHAEVRRTKQVVHVDDIRAMPPYLEGDPRLVALADLGGARTTVGVPILKGDALLGTLAIYRKEVRPFTAKQIELASNFAAQAVIAIENTRLLNELRESLEQQTATSEVLRVISSSPGELEPVFQAMLENAIRVCEAKFGILFRVDGENHQFAAEVGTPAEYSEFQRQRGPFTPRPGTLNDRVMRTKQVCRTDD
jgi:GAF domain-containing protein